MAMWVGGCQEPARISKVNSVPGFRYCGLCQFPVNGLLRLMRVSDDLTLVAAGVIFGFSSVETSENISASDLKRTESHQGEWRG